MIGAIVLAGGRGARLGGLDKAAVELDGARLVDRVVGAARASGAEPIVVVGPDSSAPEGTERVREDPPFSGPLAALDAGLARLDKAEWTLLLSCDLVDPDSVCQLLMTAFPAAEALDGVLLVDSAGHRQWLAGLYRVASLRAALSVLDRPLDGLPLRTAFQDAHLRELKVPGSLTADIDTPDDLQRARASIETERNTDELS